MYRSEAFELACSRDVSRPHILKPWRLGDLTVASDGAVLCWSPYADDAVAAPEKPAKVAPILAAVEAGKGRSVDLWALVRWAGPQPSDEGAPCGACDGYGVHAYHGDISEMDGAVLSVSSEVWPADPLSALLTCEECDGTGRWPDGLRPGVIGGVIVDTGKMAKCIRILRGLAPYAVTAELLTLRVEMLQDNGGDNAVALVVGEQGVLLAGMKDDHRAGYPVFGGGER